MCFNKSLFFSKQMKMRQKIKTSRKNDTIAIYIYVMPTRRLEVNVSTVRFTITRASITEARRCYNYKTQSPPLPKGGGGARAI